MNERIEGCILNIEYDRGEEYCSIDDVFYKSSAFSYVCERKRNKDREITK